MNGCQESLMFDAAPAVNPITLTAPERCEKKRAKGMLTLARVRELFDYDPETGAAYLKAKQELHSFQPTPRGA
jgi:hypothetical protein